MPEVQIRPATASDLPILMAIDHSCQSDYVWQMDVIREEDQTGAIFHEIRLPRSVKVSYPRQINSMFESWNKRMGMLVGAIGEQVVGYIRMNELLIHQTAWLSDMVVSSRFRRQGVGTALILAAQSWAIDRKNKRAMLEMSSKNHPAICLARKLGYEFCGYNDNFYETKDITLFFVHSFR
jgi:ribosomal protein S18 acetylase RimI-like enzyme